MAHICYRISEDESGVTRMQTNTQNTVASFLELDQSLASIREWFLRLLCHVVLRSDTRSTIAQSFEKTSQNLFRNTLMLPTKLLAFKYSNVLLWVAVNAHHFSTGAVEIILIGRSCIAALGTGHEEAYFIF